MSTNSTILGGRVGGQVKYNTTEKGKVGLFTLWHNPEGNGKSFSITVVNFGGKVDHVLPQLKKGDFIQVEGRLKGKEVPDQIKPVLELEAFKILRIERFKYTERPGDTDDDNNPDAPLNLDD